MSAKTDQETFEALVRTAQEFAPRFKVISKKSSWLHRLIGFFSKLYLTQYWTTVGSTVAYPAVDPKKDPNFPWRAWQTIPHEGRHALQARKVSEPLFIFLYLLGHFAWAILGLLLVLMVSIPLWVEVNWWSGLIPLAAFLLVSPIPFAYFRYRWEYEAYSLSIAVRYWTSGRAPDAYLDSLADQFVRWFYWFMWPFGRSLVMKRLKSARERVMIGAFAKDKYNGAVLETLKDCDRYVSPRPLP